jgi:uncharacterized protein (DUF924 family)
MDQHNPNGPGPGTSASQAPPDAARDVLDFWFGALHEGFADEPTRRRWFAAEEAFDRECTDRFGSLVDAAADGALRDWLASARGRLAYVIVTDQLSRQIHRGSARAFATDTHALAAAREGVASGVDRLLGGDERAFFYLPFEHAESRIDQHASVGLFTLLVSEAPERYRRLAAETLRYALGHRDIVLRFGRFPHRNAVLGRDSTPEEIAYLRNASRFGQ